VEINLNILGVLLLDEVGGEVDRANIVVVGQGGPRQGTMQLQNHLTKPTRLCHVVGHDAILRLGTRTGDNIRALRGPGDEVVVKKHHVAQSGPATSIDSKEPIHTQPKG
jgi:hypothetical protein